MIDKVVPDKLVDKLSEYSTLAIVLFATMIVILGSIPLVYLFTFLFEEEYTLFFFSLSVLLPVLLTPPIITLLLQLSTNLKHVKTALNNELQKNKKRDVILFEQARFALMGEMMANISHQWKQPLNTINLAVLAAKTSQTSEGSVEKYFDIIEDNVNHLASTIDDFMSFFDKKAHSEIKSLDAIVREIKSIIFTHISNKNIELDITIDNTYGDIEIASSISQVVLNLLNNAKDASLEGEYSKKIKLQLISNEYGLEIECCDNGKGISSEIADKIFDPYFTTKVKSQGTGIGLYMSKEIIQKMFDGQINLSQRVYSRSTIEPLDNSGKTCFFIAIPYSKNCILKKDYE